MRDAINSSDDQGHKEKNFESFVRFVFNKLLTPENVWAFLLFLIVIALIVFTTDSSPAWIYQGF